MVTCATLVIASTYPYVGRALDKIKKASISREKLPNDDSTKIRRGPMQDPKDPANGRNGWFHCILESIKVRRHELCEECQE